MASNCFSRTMLGTTHNFKHLHSNMFVHFITPTEVRSLHAHPSLNGGTQPPHSLKMIALLCSAFFQLCHGKTQKDTCPWQCSFLEKFSNTHPCKGNHLHINKNQDRHAANKMRIVMMIHAQRSQDSRIRSRPAVGACFASSYFTKRDQPFLGYSTWLEKMSQSQSCGLRHHAKQKFESVFHTEAFTATLGSALLRILYKSVKSMLIKSKRNSSREKFQLSDHSPNCCPLVKGHWTSTRNLQRHLIHTSFASSPGESDISPQPQYVKN